MQTLRAQKVRSLFRTLSFFLAKSEIRADFAPISYRTPTHPAVFVGRIRAANSRKIRVQRIFLTHECHREISYYMRTLCNA